MMATAETRVEKSFTQDIRNDRHCEADAIASQGSNRVLFGKPNEDVCVNWVEEKHGSHMPVWIGDIWG